MHFLCKCLIISTLNFWLFLDIFGQIGHFEVFWVKRGFLRTRIKIYKERAHPRVTNICSTFGPPASGFPPKFRSHSCANNKTFGKKFK